MGSLAALLGVGMLAHGAEELVGSALRLQARQVIRMRALEQHRLEAARAHGADGFVAHGTVGAGRDGHAGLLLFVELAQQHDAVLAQDSLAPAPQLNLYIYI